MRHAKAILLNILICKEANTQACNHAQYVCFSASYYRCDGEIKKRVHHNPRCMMSFLFCVCKALSSCLWTPR